MVNINHRQNLFRDGQADFKQNRITGAELMGMRLLRRKTRKEMAEVLETTEETIRIIEENDQDPAWPDDTKIYMTYLNCSMYHVEQLRRIVDGQLDSFREDSYIPKHIRDEVHKKDKGKCSICESDEKLHIHHIKPRSHGGLNETDNLTLVCVSCHAEIHKEDKSYHLLKSQISEVEA